MKLSYDRRTRRNIRFFAAFAGITAMLVAAPMVAHAQDSTSTPAPSTPQDSAPAAPADTQTTPAPLPPPPPVPPDTTGTVASPETSTTTTTSAPSHHFWIGPEVGVYLPTSGKTRGAFGSSWFSIGLGFGQISPAPRKGALGIDLDFIARSGSDSHVYIVPIGIQYRQALASGGSSIPYAGVSADLVFGDIRYPPDNAHSGLRTTGGGSVFIGTTLGKNAYVEARYMALGSIQGFNISGLNLGAGLRF